VFGTAVREYRRRLCLSQEELASRTGLSVRTVGKLEAGQIASPRSATVRLLADVFGLSGVERDRFCDAANPPLTFGAPAAAVAGAGGAGRPATLAQSVAPAQLPADVAGFTGRARHLAVLDALLSEGDGPAAVVIGAIAGTAGVGKTALAVHWSHRARDRFPDGQLFVNLRGFAATPPLRPIEALTRFLHALGVPPEQVPMDVEEAAALYRSLLAERRMLVVLDNASEPDQVRPLLPGSPLCRVLVTSRDEMAGLVARDGARRLGLHVLAAPESHDLLGRLLGPERAAAQPQQLAELAELCAHLPLALRIAAANLDRGGYPTVGDYVAELRAADRLVALAVDGDAQAAVRAAFDLSYANLPESTRRLFRLVGLVPGPDVTPDAAAALLDATSEEARQLLSRLADAHLIERTAGAEPRSPDRPRRDRFTCHDLLREYAREQAMTQESGTRRQAAMDRLFEYYLHTAAAATALLDPDKLRLPLPDRMRDRRDALAFADDVQAVSWLDAEQSNLVAAITHAAAHGPRPMAWLLADSLRGYYRLRAVDWQTVALSALAAAEADNEPRAQTTAHLSLGRLRARVGRYAEAIDHYNHALALARQSGWLEAQAAALLNAGVAHTELGQLVEAADRARSALAILRQIGPPSRTAAALNNLGLTLAHLGRSVEATDYYTQALELYRRVGYRAGEAMALGNLAWLYHDIGRTEEALAHLHEALALYPGTDDQLMQAMTLNTLAVIHCDAGRYRQAFEAARSALALARELDGRRAEAWALCQLARTHEQVGQHKQAVPLYHQALRLAREGRDRLPELDILIGLANAGRKFGTLGEATEHAKQALSLARRYGYRVREGRARTALAGLYLDAGDPDRAIDEATRAAAIQRETGHRLGEADTLAILGDAVSQRDGPAAAIPHWRQALALYTAIGAPRADELSALLASVSDP
jgi:tetratricopeptide (TPR) repeat protein/DNA-binding XRE family transcriptional regulator